MVNESDVIEFELKQKGFNIELRKKEALTKPIQVIPYFIFNYKLILAISSNNIHANTTTATTTTFA